MATGFPRESGIPGGFGTSLPAQLGGRIKWGVIIIGVLILIALLSYLRSIYTDWLWFDEIGYRSVFIKILTTRIALFFIGAVVFAIPLAISLYYASRLSQGPEEIPLPPGAREILKSLILLGTIGAGVVLSVVFGAIAAMKWETFLKFWSSVPFGTEDPVFGYDVSFYVFSLPVYSFIQAWLLGAAIVILIATLGLYFVNYSFRGVGFQISTGLKVHVSVLGAIIMFCIAFGHWVDRWDLLLSDQGAVFGAAYADLHSRMPALLILTIIAGASGILMLVNAYLGGLRMLVGAVVLWAAMAILLGALWPNLMQRFSVRPNELTKESEYIARNIEFTRSGFGLEGVVGESYPAERHLTTEMVADNPQTIDNIRLWDHGPLVNVYRQLQIIRPYYEFKDADVDRYVVDGNYRQVMLAAREVAPEKLDPDSQTWVNTKLRYTHGFGLAMSPVTEFTTEGKPEFFAKDIPPDGKIRIRSTSPDAEPDIIIDNPRVYYGENTVNYVIVNSKTDELDFEGEAGKLQSTNYFGTGGVPLGSFIRRIAYAWQFGDINILISGEITGDSLIQYRREIQERIASVAPFLRLDEDPYLVASPDVLYWIQDAYTLTDKYPYSDPHVDGFNYVRNSVKVTVDAFNGTLKFYVADPTDPIIQTYEKIFPDLFKPLDEMPASLRDHVRYPQDLFQFQAGKYLRYHMEDPQDFYNLEDIWRIPNEKFGQTATTQPVMPYYVIMKIPGEEKEEFVLMIPFTRSDPPIVAGWLAARSDGANYGKLVAFLFPKDRQLEGPEQIEIKIDNDPDISQWFTLRCVVGSTCIRGNLLVIPLQMGGNYGLLYAEPIYLQAEGFEFPELTQVILASGDDVVMEGSVPAAVAALTGYSYTAGVPPAQVEAPGPVEAELPADKVRSEIDSIDDAIQKLKEGLSGLQEALERLRALTGGE